MAEGEPSILKMAVIFYGTDFLKGCSDFTCQTDSGNKRTLDLCMVDRITCPFYDGQYQTRGETEPTGELSQYDCGIAEGVDVGFCRLQKDAIRLGPFTLFDKRWIRPTPREEQK